MKKKLALGMLSLLLGLAGRTNADVIASFTGVGSERDIHIAFNNTFTNPVTNSNEYVATGFYQWSGVAANPAGLQTTFNTFCIDFAQDISYNQPPYVYQLASLDVAPSDIPVYKDPNLSKNGMGATRANAIRELWGLNYSGLDSADKVAGFQLAIWKILYEPTITQDANASIDLSTGNFRTTDSGAFVTYANQYLGSIISNGQYRTDHLATDLYALTNSQFQDQIVELPGGIPNRGPNPVPLPSAAGAGGLLLLGLAKTQRRRLVRA